MAHPSSDSVREISILRRIVQTGNAIKELCPMTHPHLNVQSSISPHRIVLPPPPSLHTKLVNLGLGLEPPIIENITRIYSLRSSQLHSSIQDALRRACHDLSNVPHHSALMPLPQLLDGVIAAHTSSYAKALQKLEQRALAVAAGLMPREAQRHGHHTKRKADRRAFNHEFIPFLQKYFEHNGYPSAVDREAMAKKSMMEPRQIEVWFQNHRRRAKSEGKPVPRLGPADPAPFDLCLKSFEEQMGHYLIPEPLRQSVDTEVSEAGSDDEEDDEDNYDDEKPEEVDLSDVLNPPAARHAFPTPFARCRNTASAILPTQAFYFPPPDWPRKVSVTPANRPTVTIDECVAAFAGMHVYDKMRVLCPPFRSATTVIPPSTPLPAFVRGKFTPHPVAPLTALNIIPAPRSRQHPFRSPSPYAQPLTLASASPRRKKVAGPPRRTPKRSSGAHRGVSPATSDTSTLRSSSEHSTMRSGSAAPLRSLSPPSRTPSLESSGFSPSRTPSFDSSSLSSRSSSGSSGPTTPTGSPSALPLDIAAYADADGSYQDIFGDVSHLQQYADAARHYSGRKQQRQFAFEGY